MPQTPLRSAAYGTMVEPGQTQSPNGMPDQTANGTDGAARRTQAKTMQPAQGVWVRYAQNASVEKVTAEPGKTEIRLNSGLANVDVHQPVKGNQILVDMPSGGQIAILKDGVYTFNADSQTVTVFKGEAEAFNSADANHAVKIKEDHQVNFALATDGGMRSTELDPHNAGADLIPTSYAPGYGDGAYVTTGYYPGAFYGDPYAYYGFGYPYGWGYPYFGVGFGYYGGYGYRGGYGFRGGYGYRGGYGGGFAGRGGFGGGGFHGGGGGGRR